MKHNMKRIALYLVLTVFVFGVLTGCGKKADCEISFSHAHKYTNEYGYIRYINRENLEYERYVRGNDCKV